jgi:hypothetical protein
MKLQGTSTTLLSQLEEGDRLVVMGPTGVRANIVENQSVLIIGGFLALEQLQSLLPALKEKGNQVYFFGCFKQQDDLLLVNDLLGQCAGYDISIAEDWGEHTLNLQAFVHQAKITAPLEVRVVGYDQLLLWIKAQRQLWLDQALPEKTSWIGSVYGPMQCMLKGVCAQCLQWQIDPTTGERTKAVYACSWQDQPFEKIDIVNIGERLSQNQLQEKLNQLWLAQQQNMELS